MRSPAAVRLPLLLTLALASACGAKTGLRLFGGSETETSEGGTSQGGAPGGGAPEGGGGAGPGGMGGEGGTGGMPPECEPGALLVYLVSSNNVLYSYKPSNGQLKTKGVLSCDSSGNASPFSMSVDRQGVAFVLYNDGNLYRVATKDASCESTAFVPNQNGFLTFGMGFARNLDTETDELFVSDIKFGGTSNGLARIDTDTLDLTVVGPYDSPITDRMEMTSASDGNLYGYSLDQNGGGGWVVQLDKTTAAVLDQTFLPVGDQSSALAFAFWNDDFYIFTSGGSVTDVTRYRPADGSVTALQQIGDVIVGAGVSTCDPM